MSLDRRLTDAARLVAERVEPPEVDLGAVRAGARASRRRTVALTVAAAAGVVALAGIPLLGGGREATAPRPATSTSTEVVRDLGSTPCNRTRCLSLGLYRIGLGFTVDGTAPLSAMLRVDTRAWAPDGSRHRLWMEDDDGGVMVSVYRLHRLASSSTPCAPATTAVTETAGARDVAAQLTALPQFDVMSGPTLLQAFGRETQYLELETDRLSCPPVEAAQYNLADIYGRSGVVPEGDSDVDPDQPVRIRFWVLDLGGHPFVVEAREEGRPTDEMVGRLNQVLATLTFGDEG